jgi:putative transposase
MVGPARKREAVRHLQGSLEMSERRACGVVGQSRSTQRYAPRKDSEESRLREELRRISRERPRAGYRMAARCLRRVGWRVNDKRVQRLWREEGLRVPQRTHKRRRLGAQCQGSQRLRARRPNEVWSYDFIQDRTVDGRRLKILVVVDEYTRECLALEVGRKLTAGDVIKVLARLIGERGAPVHLRSDNGPEFLAHAVRQWLSVRGIGTLFIEPGSPWENAYCESFNSRLRDEFLNRELFTSELEARVLSAEWRRDYNEARPHSALDDHTPAEFAARWRATVGATPLPSLASATNPKPQEILS